MSGTKTLTPRLRLSDFDYPEQNDWLVVNQFTVIEGQHNRRRVTRRLRLYVVAATLFIVVVIVAMLLPH